MKIYQRSLVRLIRQVTGRPKRGVEIGVYRGATSRCLGSWFRDCELTFVDPWVEWPQSSPYFKVTRRDGGKHTQDEWDEIYEEALDNILCSGVRKFEIKRMMSDAAAYHTPDKWFDFTFIDAAHDYHNAKRDIQLWLPKTKKLICGHDYGNMYKGVKTAVDEIFGDRVEKKPGAIWYVVL